MNLFDHKLYKTEGVFCKNFNLQNASGKYNVFVSLYFIEDQMVLFILNTDQDTMQVDEKFKSHIREQRQQLLKMNAEERFSSELLTSGYEKIGKCVINKHGDLEANFIDNKDSNQKMKVWMIKSLWGGQSIYVETKVMNYDFENYDNSGYKEKRLINCESIDFVKL